MSAADNRFRSVCDPSKGHFVANPSRYSRRSVPGSVTAADPSAISACVVVRNEGASMERCLVSLEGVVDEVIVIHDGPCEDDTLEIAERHGAQVFVRPLVGGAEPHRPFSYERARGDWILNVDADEFLSAALRAELPALARRGDASAFEFLWRIWNGQRYVTDSGPFKRAMFRRDDIRMLGVMQAQELIDGRVVRTQLHLEHRPGYNNYALSTMASKWRRWARIQARQFLTDFEEIPKFNYPGTDWPWQRKLSNRLSPLLPFPYALAITAVMFFRLRSELPLGQALRLAASIGIYNGMVQAYVAKYLYLDRGRGR